MDPARLFRLHRARVRAGDASVLRSRAPLGERRAGRVVIAVQALGLSVADALLSALFSPVCAACNALLDHPAHSAVCERCWQSIVPLTPPLCVSCGDALRTWRNSSGLTARCARCRRSTRAVDRAAAIGGYEGALRAIVHALKYDGRRSLARPLAALMRTRGDHVLADVQAVVPVPLHRSRQRERGFNQAADLAYAIGLPVIHALARRRPTAAQVGLPAGRRHANVRGAFAGTQHATSLRGAIVVLIDDVCTTGATLEACARVLKALGVAEVRALTAARAASGQR